MIDQDTGTNKEKADVKKQLRHMERELSELYRDLGKMMLDIAGTEGEKANRLVDRIIDKRCRLKALHGETQCDACGLYNEADSRYCKHCGCPLEPDGYATDTEKKEEPL